MVAAVLCPEADEPGFTPQQMPPLIVARTQAARGDNRCHLFLQCFRAPEGESYVEVLGQWVPACRRCAEKLRLPYRSSTPCPTCGGDGKLPGSVDEYSQRRPVVCYACSGTGTAYASWVDGPELPKVPFS